MLYQPVGCPFGAEAALMVAVAAAVKAGDLVAAVEIINVDLSGYTRALVGELWAGPAWSKLRQLAAPGGAELAAINRYSFAPQTWAIPKTVVAGEHSRCRAPYGSSVDLFLSALRVNVAAGR